MKYTWLKDGKIVSNTSTFTIPSVDISDQGTYECVVGNAAGEKRKNVRMEIECKWPEAYIGGYQTSVMELFAKISKSF